uniref:Exosome component 9 n=1 Tax=Oncorhynchus kisutch TaxID=8019 RepID=A0A8C7HJ35_ONCKI
MRDTPLSNCERDFLLKAIQETKRLDGRQTYDYRSIKISFGTDYGCCFVDLGKTRRYGISCTLLSDWDWQNCFAIYPSFQIYKAA